MTESEKQDAMNRVCEELLGNDMGMVNEPHIWYSGNDRCVLCGYKYGLRPESPPDCIPRMKYPRDFCSDDSPRSLLQELISKANTVHLNEKFKDVIGTRHDYSWIDTILCVPAREIVEAVLKATGNWNSKWKKS